MRIRELPLAQCTALIAENRLARLACSTGDQPYLVPIFYAYADRCTYSFTMPGRKLDVMRGNPRVALLVEEKGEFRSWQSVVAEGRFEEIPDKIGFKRERERA
jgi:nitroimidazol reductase NimA-like FMN-containing flavoprotein (pyridoxamine 5'-phosphate oxidase superfamily)